MIVQLTNVSGVLVVMEVDLPDNTKKTLLYGSRVFVGTGNSPFQTYQEQDIYIVGVNQVQQ